MKWREVMETTLVTAQGSLLLMLAMFLFIPLVGAFIIMWVFMVVCDMVPR